MACLDKDFTYLKAIDRLDKLHIPPTYKMLMRTIHFRINIRIYRCQRIRQDKLQPSETPKSNFVLLVDIFGSMDSSDRLSLLKPGLKELLVKPNPDDRISLINYLDDVQKSLYDLIFLSVSENNKSSLNSL